MTAISFDNLELSRTPGHRGYPSSGTPAMQIRATIADIGREREVHRA